MKLGQGFKEVVNGKLMDYIDRNGIGVPPLSQDDPLFHHILEGMALSIRNLSVSFNVCRVSSQRVF